MMAAKSAAGSITRRSQGGESPPIQRCRDARSTERHGVEANPFGNEPRAHCRIVRGIDRRNLIAMDTRRTKRSDAVDHRPPGCHFIFDDDDVLPRREAEKVLSSRRRTVMVLAKADHPLRVRLP